MFPWVFVFKFKDTSLECVNDVGFSVLVISFVLSSVSHMHMTVDKELGMVLVHQGVEHLEALVGKITAVIQLIGR